MVIYSEVGNTLNQVDIHGIQAVKQTDDNEDNVGSVFSFLGRKIINDTLYYMIAPFSHKARTYDDKTGNYTGVNAKRVFIQRRAIDVDKNTFESLLHNHMIYGMDELTDINEYLICKDGYYDDKKLIVITKVKLKHGSVILFAKGDGTLCSLLEGSFIEALDSGYKAPFISVIKGYATYIRCRTDKVFMYNTKDEYVPSRELSYLSLLWYNGCMAVGQKRFPELNLVEKYIRARERYEQSEDNLYQLFGGLNRGLYFNNFGEYSSTDNRWKMFLTMLGYADKQIAGLLNTTIYDTYLDYKTLYKNYPLTIRFRLSKIPIEDGINYGDWNTERCHSVYKFFILEDRYFCIRVCLTGIYQSDCVMATLKIDLSDMSLSFDEVRVYTYTHENWIGSMGNINDFGRIYELLTGDSKYLGTKQVDLRRSNDDNTLKTEIKELSIDTFLEQLYKLGYKKKSRNILPDYVYMSINKSAWLNEREFVTLREYKGNGKEEYQLDLYHDGKYHSTVVGDFTKNALETLLKFNDTKGQSSYKEYPIVVAEQFEKGRNRIYYTTEDLFTEYSTKYNTYRENQKIGVLGKGYFTVARVNATGEYSIVYTFGSKYGEQISYVLVRFNEEHEMFSAYTEILKVVDRYSEGLDSNYLIGYALEPIVLDSQVHKMLKRLGKDIDKQNLVTQVMLKYFGYTDKEWRKIFYMVSDTIYNSMIFD